jgi:O-antigen ligase
MTTSTSSEQLAATAHADAAAATAAVATTTNDGPPSGQPPALPTHARAPVADAPRTLWSRFIILILCLAVVLSTLAFGTVHTWSLGIFQAGAGVVLALWMLDAWRSRSLRLSRNFLQLPLLGLIIVGLVQLLPLGAAAGGDAGGLASDAARSISFDPYATRLVVVQLSALLIYFAAALAFIDSPRRLRLVVRLVIIFGFALAMFGLMQHFVSPSMIYWLRESKQSLPFGPYVNRHHFAGYMELTLALPLGLLFAGAVERDRMPLYAFATALMCIALVMTNSRGGMLSMLAEIVFLVLVSVRAGRGKSVRGEEEPEQKGTRIRALALRVALAFGMVVAVVFGALYFGGEESLSRLVGTVNAADPTTGRAHFWKGTIEIIKDHPITGTGLGAFSAVYPRYDTGNGMYRLEQAHNDYLQILSDAGVLGGLLGLLFLVALFRMALSRMQSHDRFRRGVALGALAGCAGVLVHSFFDFTLHPMANALLFLLLAALATMNGRVEEPEVKRRRKRRRRHRSGEPHAAEESAAEQLAA